MWKEISLFEMNLIWVHPSSPFQSILTERTHDSATPKAGKGYLPTYLSFNLPSYLYTCLPSYLPTYLPSYLSTYLHSYIFIHPSIYLPTFLPIYLPTYLPTYLSTYLPVYLSIFLPIYLSTYLVPQQPDVQMCKRKRERERERWRLWVWRRWSIGTRAVILHRERICWAFAYTYLYLKIYLKSVCLYVIVLDCLLVFLSHVSMKESKCVSLIV